MDIIRRIGEFRICRIFGNVDGIYTQVRNCRLGSAHIMTRLLTAWVGTTDISITLFTADPFLASALVPPGIGSSGVAQGPDIKSPFLARIYSTPP